MGVLRAAVLLFLGASLVRHADAQCRTPTTVPPGFNVDSVVEAELNHDVGFDVTGVQCATGYGGAPAAVSCGTVDTAGTVTGDSFAPFDFSVVASQGSVTGTFATHDFTTTSQDLVVTVDGGSAQTISISSDCDSAANCAGSLTISGATVTTTDDGNDMVITSDSFGSGSSVAIDGGSSGSEAAALFGSPVMVTGVDATSQDLVVTVDGGSAQTISISSNCDSAANCAGSLTISGATVTTTDDGNDMVITSDSFGSGSSVAIDGGSSGSEAAALFGSSPVTVDGTDAGEYTFVGCAPLNCTAPTTDGYNFTNLGGSLSGDTFAPTGVECDGGFVSPGGIAFGVCAAEGADFTVSGCTACGVGQFDDGADEVCDDCQPGFFYAALGGVPTTECTACSAGRFMATAGQSACADCERGSHTVNSSGTFTDQAAVDCVLCPAGSYSNVLYGAAECQLCTAGSSTSTSDTGAPFTETGSQFCVPCPIGAYSDHPTGGQQCVDCVSGSETVDDTGAYADSGAHDCVQCPNGKFNADVNTACEDCSLGSETQSDSGSYVAIGASLCTACLPGSFNDNSSTSCEACAAGTVQPAAGQSSCDNCTAGFYDDGTEVCDPCSDGEVQPEEGQTECNACLAGFFDDGTEVCADCDAGRVQPGAGTTDCIDCNPGFYDDGTETCADCAPGSVQPSPATTACDNCTAGFFDDDTEVCAGCADGDVQPIEGQTSCDNCQPGFYDNGTEVCDSCSDGEVQPLISQTECNACLAGFFDDGTEVCADCDAGRVQPGAGTTDCIDCNPGFYDDGTETCADCAPGSVQPSPATTACDNCTAGFFDNSTEVCDSCEAGSQTVDGAGGFVDTGAIGCDPCANGRYSGNAAGATECQNCQPGYQTELGGIYASSGADACVACITGLYSGDPLGATACIYCTAGNQTNEADRSTYTDTAAVSCDHCVAGRFRNDALGNVSCQECPAGYQTADVADPADLAGSTFMLTGATACAACYGNFSNHTTEAAQHEPSVSARGFFDDDSSSATPCVGCIRGMYADEDGLTACLDYDECASSPCENGAICSHGTSSTDSSLAVYACACDNGFSGFHCELLDECALNPCILVSSSPPTCTTEGVACTSENRFACPVEMVCADPDIATTDNYLCTCPSCVDSILSTSSADLLTDYFSTHPAFARYVASKTAQLEDPTLAPNCRDPLAQGCTDTDAVNYDSAASIDDGSCIPKLYGCMDQRAVNYNATANSYDPTGGNGTRELCYGAYCTSSGSVPTQPLSLEQNVTLCPYTDAAGEHDGSCTCDDGSAPVVYGPGDNSLDECRGSTVDQCLSSVHRLCNPLTGEAGSPPNVTGDCGPRQAFSCMDAADTNFTCVDPNPYWLGDYTCGCAHDTCGSDVVFTDSTRDMSITNYALTQFLKSASTTRSHVCRLIGNPLDC